MEAATNAVIAPWAQLGIIGSVVLALGIVVAILWRSLNNTRDAHMADVKACSERTEAMLGKQFDSNNNLAKAMEGLERVIDSKMRP
jgi:hypothetical protein